MKNIKFIGKIGKYTNGKEYLNVAEDLEFTIDHSFKKNAEIYFVANNGVAVKKGKIKDNEFKLPISYLRLGKLSLKIEEVTNEGVEVYTVEDLIIMTNDNKIETIPEVDKLKEEIETYSKLVNKLERQNEILTKLVGGLYDTEIKVGNEDD